MKFRIPKLHLLLLFSFLIGFTGLIGQSTSISGIVNQYYQVNTVNPSGSLTLAGNNALASGDLALLIQMQGADLNLNGSISNYHETGNYEFVTIASVSGTNVTLNSALTRNYDPVNRQVQLVRIPQYESATVSGKLVAQAWNGQTGGVLALDVCGLLTLNDSIDVTAMGFRGGLRRNGVAQQGEGISPLGQANSQAARANGGGGGRYHNSGGGAGSAWGRGGNGANTYCSYCGNAPGGTAGYNLDYLNGDRVFLGGGGGGGNQNNGNGQHGGAGGGIIFLRAGSIQANGHGLIANGGMSIRPNSTNDGGGGGGGGGSILLDCPQLLDSLGLEVGGGNSQYVCCGSSQSEHGGGGGGGGGMIYHSAPLSANLYADIAGGIGTRRAPDGNPGTVLLGLSLPVAPCGPAYCESGAQSAQYEWIANVALANLNHPSGTDGGYGDYAAFSATLTAGNMVTLTLSPGFSAGQATEYWRVWVDWNGDGDFWDPGEDSFQGSGNGVLTGSIAVPANAASGPLRMRVSMAWDQFPTGPCCHFFYGEVEDYTLYVTGSNALAPSTAKSGLSNSYSGLGNQPGRVELLSLSPNPILAGKSLDLRFRCSESSGLKLEIFNIQGKHVFSLLLQGTAGFHEMVLPSDGLRPGIYFLSLKTNCDREAIKFVIH